METLARDRVIQTGTHVTASEGPIFFAMHAVATLALAKDAPCFVGACSGIPFSNNARPGSLNFSRRHPLSALLHGRSRAYRLRAPAFEKSDSDERRLSLVPWSMREAPVWRSTIPRELAALLPVLRSPLRDLLPAAVTGAPFAALRSMYVTEFNADVARIAVREKDAPGWREEPIMAFRRVTATDVWAGRLTPSRHNTSAPDMVFNAFRAESQALPPPAIQR